MLNKLYYFMNSNPLNLLKQSDEIKRYLMKYLISQNEFIRLIDIPKGTLGVVLRCDGLYETPVFIKTHLNGKQYYNSFQKECFLFKKINRGIHIFEEKMLSTQNNQQYLIAIMDWLVRAQELLPEEVLEVIQRYQYAELDLRQFNMYDITLLLEEAKLSLRFLYHEGLYSEELEKKVGFLLKKVEEYLYKTPRKLCHGDLSSKNIMKNNIDRNIIVDWEDAFWGIEGYDYLYWLSFFENRKYYLDYEVFLKSKLPIEISAGILVLILLVKNSISFYSKSYVNNRISFEDRIEEVIKYTRLKI